MSSGVGFLEAVRLPNSTHSSKLDILFVSRMGLMMSYHQIIVNVTVFVFSSYWPPGAFGQKLHPFYCFAIPACMRCFGKSFSISRSAIDALMSTPPKESILVGFSCSARSAHCRSSTSCRRTHQMLTGRS